MTIQYNHAIHNEKMEICDAIVYY